ncbi:MAG: sigma-54 dependent transcriptional regulator [Alphaproteobacteria bacterium]
MTLYQGSPEPEDRISGARQAPLILVVENDAAIRRMKTAALSPVARVIDVADMDAALAALDSAVPALVLVSLDAIDGPDAGRIELLRFTGYEGPVLASTAQGSLTLAVAAMRAGACDVIIKPAAPMDLRARVARAMAAHSPPPKAPERSEPSAQAFEGFIGTSPAMVGVYDQITRIAPSKAPVFVTGESGTGKEVTAQAIHTRSGRTAKRFHALNCGAIPKDLMESEIFGHVKGAFTGATEDRPGAAEIADGGTLFLDEICEMDLALQAKLLRFIQTGEVRRVGDTRTRTVDVRFVCATNRDPLAEVASGRFREDLYYRLCVLPIHLPALRERGEDVLALASAFLTRFAAEEGRHFTHFEPAAARLIASYEWPGNVRQLQNVIRRLIVMHDGEAVTAAMLPLALAHGSWRQPEIATEPASAVEPFWMQEKRIIEQALAAFDGNLSRAAAALEISPSTIYRKREAWSKGIQSAAS